MCTIAAAGLAVSIAAAAASGYGQMQQAKSQQALYKAEAKVAKQNQEIANAQAADAVKRGGEADIELRRKYASTKGKQVAAIASSGVALDEGSALSALQDTDMFEQVDSGRVRDNARREEWGYQVQGVNYANNAAMSRTAASNVASAAPWAVGGTLLSAAGDVSDKWVRYKEAGLEIF